MKKMLLIVLVLLPNAPAHAADALFKSLPVASRSNGRTTVSFELSRPSDVEVAVLDAGGKVVRHFNLHF